ncbi:metallophosphoesterase [Hallella colorans]|uniref:metallophosphoesterase n=1 Tax=Hallella colorans TaxID=1703337 RepID=UPI003013082A
MRVPIKLQTNKTTGSVKKIVMLSDLHVGYHIDRKELSSWVDKINDENADLILIGGDIIDGRMRPLIEENMAEEFRRFNAPVYACIGNHEYYTGKKAAEKFYREANINLLIDQTVTVKGINIIGRDDRTNEKRCSLKDLTGHLDMRKFTILLDHQPYHLEQAEEAGIDFQLSGHTHYGQMWPINWIEDVIYEKAHGALTKGNTQYYISSGIGIWGAKFRLGTQSEYVVAQLPITIKQNTAKNKRDRNAN